MKPSYEFCFELFSSGTITVRPQGAADDSRTFAERNATSGSQADDDQMQRDLVLAVDRVARAEAPGCAPALDTDAANWGLCLLEWCAGMMVDRSLVTTELPKELAQGEPKGDQASHHWSVDLGLRYLQMIIVRTRGLAAADPLLELLEAVTRRWPMACVGTQVVWDSSRVPTVLGHESLRQLLLERILDDAIAVWPSMRTSKSILRRFTSLKQIGPESPDRGVLID